MITTLVFPVSSREHTVAFASNPRFYRDSLLKADLYNGEHVSLIPSLTMLDGFEILTTSGVVLWSKYYVPVSGSIINGFIKDVFIEEKVLPGASVTDDTSATQKTPYRRDQYTLKWASVKDLGLIFVVRIAHAAA